MTNIVYTCPKCGKDLRIVMLASNPPKTVYECSCGWRAEEQQKQVRVPWDFVHGE